MVNLITDHIDIWTSAETQKTNGAGRGNHSSNHSLHGIKKLRELILELAVCGKLVHQDPKDEPASVLLKKGAAEKTRLVKEGKISKQKIFPEITEDEKVFELSTGWEWIRLGEIGVWAIGAGFPKKEQGYEDLEILFSKVSDMNLEGNEKYIYTTNNTISENTASKLKINVHLKDTVIFPKIGGAIATNKRRIIVKPTAIDNNCLGITPTVAFDTEYLHLYLSSLDLTEYQVGTSVPALSQGTLELISLGLPPLAEQHRIVAKVDELMAMCDQLEQKQTDSNSAHQTLVETLLATLTSVAKQDEFIEAWQRIANHFDILFTTEKSIDQFKQTILQLAVMGKLVPQNPNNEPASVLLKKIALEKARLIKEGKLRKQEPLSAIADEEKPFEIPQGWKYVRFGDVTYNRDSERVPLSVDERSGRQGDYDYYGASGIIDSIDKYLFDKPLLLIGEDGANLINRSTPIAFIARGKYWVNNHAHVIDGLEEQFLLYICLHINAISLEPYVTGTAQPKMNQAKMNSIVLALPPLSEQHRIVDKVDELMALCDTLKARIKDAQTTQIQLADAIVERAIA